MCLFAVGPASAELRHFSIRKDLNKKKFMQHREKNFPDVVTSSDKVMILTLFEQGKALTYCWKHKNEGL